MNISNDSIVIGVVRGVRGLKGELRVQSTTEVTERFEEGNGVFLGGVERKIMLARSDLKGILLQLDGITNREDAKTYLGMELSIPRSEGVPNPPGRYFHYQLIGLKVFDEDEVYLGELVEVIETGANDVYVVAKEGQRDILLPVVTGVIKMIDVERTRMDVSVPQGLGRV